MIDWARVTDLRSEIGDEAFAEVIDLFLEETDEVILRLATPLNGPDLARDMHFLKGSSLNLGFRDLAMLCSDGERLAMANGDAASKVTQILPCYDASKRAFRQGLDRIIAA